MAFCSASWSAQAAAPAMLRSCCLAARVSARSRTPLSLAIMAPLAGTVRLEQIGRGAEKAHPGAAGPALGEPSSGPAGPLRAIAPAGTWPRLAPSPKRGFLGRSVGRDARRDPMNREPDTP